MMGAGGMDDGVLDIFRYLCTRHFDDGQREIKSGLQKLYFIIRGLEYKGFGHYYMYFVKLLLCSLHAYVHAG